ncbi:MAG: ABC transporter ATP-binding protein [Ignavibacteria bacterium]|nr:ABC transporter ATP-binding protein [Ignavibacteria bacterium]
MKIVELKNISKRFGTILANDDITLSIEQNKIHCIIGENGAGKSTLMKILFGIYKQDQGEIYIRGERVNFRNSHDAINLKIGMLHQHFMLIEDFTILENVILGAELSKGYKLDFEKSRVTITELIRKYDLDLNPDELVYKLSISEKQKVELLKLLYRNSEILILDEPTAVLTPIELKGFFKILNNFKAEGKTIILITHKLNEVKEISDKVSVLRKGKLVYETDKEKIDISELSRLIIGDIEDIPVRNKIDNGQALFKDYITVKNLSLIENGIIKLNNLNFALKKHSVFGICGVEGNGQNELIEVLIGLNKKFKGEIYPEKLVPAIVPDDRTKKGMIGEMSISENYFLREKNLRFAFKNILKNIELKFIKRFDISVPYSGCKVKYLSGGNQQKAIVAREIMLNHNILIFSHPTRGVDLRARDIIHNEIISERNKGKAIILISSDLDELLSLSDELAIIYKGTFLKVFLFSELKEKLESDRTSLLENIGELMMGVVK